MKFFFNLIFFHFNKVIIELLSPVLQDAYPSLDDIIQAINSFAILQGYTIVKRYTKTNKKRVTCKAVLMFDHSKKHSTENLTRRNISIRKTDCLFDGVAIMKNEK